MYNPPYLCKSMKTAIMYVTHIFPENIVREIEKLSAETSEKADLYVVYQSDRVTPPAGLRTKTHGFSVCRLNGYGYRSWGCTIMDGNFHFVLLDFFLSHPDYDYYWLVEYDVRFSGNWNTFFTFFEDKDEDFWSACIETYSDNCTWIRWHEIELTGITADNSFMLKSFNPICRFSNRALRLLHGRCLLGDRGHNEVLMATLFRYFDMSIADFGGQGSFVSPGCENLFYKEDVSGGDSPGWTHRYRPMHKESEMRLKDMIYHPVK